MIRHVKPDQLTESDRAALQRWASYPAQGAPRIPCVFCGRSFTVPCATAQQAQGCGNARERAGV